VPFVLPPANGCILHVHESGLLDCGCINIAPGLASTWTSPEWVVIVERVCAASVYNGPRLDISLMRGERLPAVRSPIKFPFEYIDFGISRNADRHGCSVPVLPVRPTSWPATEL